MVTLSRNNSETVVVDNPVLMFLIRYLSGGLNGLDQFLNSPEIVYYPQYFFRVPFILLNKLDITQVDTLYTVPTFYIPFPTNVYTYVGEFIHDFGYFFFLPCFFSGLLVMSLLLPVYTKQIILFNDNLFGIIFCDWTVFFCKLFSCCCTVVCFCTWRRDRLCVGQ